MERSHKQAADFLENGGETVNLIRSMDWSNHSLGPYDRWPQSLRTTLSIMLTSKLPALLVWGPEQFLFYNDACSPFLYNKNKDKHSVTPGQKAADIWPDMWTGIKREIDQILTGGETTLQPDRLIPVYRNEKFEESYWTCNYSKVIGESGDIAGVLVNFHETTKAVKAEIKLDATEQRLKDIIEHSTNLFYTHTPDHVLTYLSPQSEAFLGYPPEEAMNRWTEFGTDHPVNAKGLESTERAIKTGKAQPVYELELKKKSGEIIWVEVNEAPVVRDGKTVAIVGSLTDITDRKRAQKEISESLKEKETLLAEIHHRVKNNLAVITGLMFLQAAEEENEAGATSTLHDSINRIKAIANIHEHLYQSGSFSRLDFNENIKKLIPGVVKSIKSEARVEILYECEPVYLNINQALPCSLIVNEIIINILKHAFIGREDGVITVCLSEDDNFVRLNIRDNGIGMPESFEGNEKRSLGLNLVDILSRQLKGKYNYGSSEKGTEFSLWFEKSEKKGAGNAHL